MVERSFHKRQAVGPIPTPGTNMSNLPRLFLHESFEIVYRRLALPLWKFLIKRMGGDQQAAEEVFSRTISAAWAGWHTFRHKSSYFTWICRIGLNKVADYYRDQVNDNSRWVLPLLENLTDADPNKLSPLEKLELAELRASLRECLNLLPDDKRRLLQFRYWRELSIKQIATLTGSSERGVEGKIYRAKKLLKSILLRRHPDIAVQTSV